MKGDSLAYSYFGVPPQVLPLGKNQNKFCLFARLFVLWRSAEGTPARKKSKQVLFFRSLIRTLAIAEGTSVDFVFLLLTRHSMQASSALVSFVGSEIPQTSLVFRSLIRTLAVAEGTSARKKSKQVLFFRSLIRTFAHSYAEA